MVLNKGPIIRAPGLINNGSEYSTPVDLPITLKNGQELRFSDVGDSHYVGFQAPALTATQIWTLPTADGTNAQVLVTNGSGVLSWASSSTTGDMADGLEATPGLPFADDTNTGIWSSAADTFNISTGGTERLEIDSAGFSIAVDTFIDDGMGQVIGHPAQVSGLNIAELQVLGTGAADSSVILMRSTANEFSGSLQFIKSRDGTISSFTIVEDNDVVGQIAWLPDDGVDYGTIAATLTAEVDDATPEAGGVGMAIVLKQMIGGGTSAARETFRVAADGEGQLANGAPKFLLGTKRTYGTTQPTNLLQLHTGTAPSGAVTTSVGLYTGGTVMSKIIADGTISNVEA